MQTIENDEVIAVPHRLVWEYRLEGSAVWHESDSYTLLFLLIPLGNVAAYRPKLA